MKKNILKRALTLALAALLALSACSRQAAEAPEAPAPEDEAGE